jgi:hypothetical protein
MTTPTQPPAADDTPNHGRLRSLWDADPLAVLAVVQAALVVAVSFGVALTQEQTGGILLLAGTVLTLVTRRKVSHTDLPPDGWAVENGLVRVPPATYDRRLPEA